MVLFTLFYDKIIFQDLLYNKKKQNGFLFNKFHNANKKDRVTVPIEPNLNQEIELTDEEKTKLLHDLKRTIIRSDSQSAHGDLKSKLLETIETRREFIRQDLSQYLGTCSFYFADPKMVFVNSY